MAVRGARYLHILVTCPLGWGTKSADSIKLARLATQCGLFPVFEAEFGEVTASTPIRERVPVEDYLRPQRRFAHLFGRGGDEEALERLRQMAERNIRIYGLEPQGALT